MRVDSISSSSILDRIQPEPKVKGSSFLNVAKSVLGAVADTAIDSAVPGDINALLEKQMAMQMRMLQTSMISNVSKTQHEASMAPVRNIRAG